MDWWQEAADLARDPLAAMDLHEDDLGSCCRRQTPALPDAALLGREVIARRATESSRPCPKELKLLTANEEPELVANDVEEPELPVANGAKDTELVTANEVEEPELVADVLATQHDIGTQTEPMMTEASTQTLRVWQVC